MMAVEPINPQGVYFLDEVCERIRISRRTANRLLRAQAFPLVPLKSLDKRLRYSGAEILRYLEDQQQMAHGRSLRFRRG